MASPIIQIENLSFRYDTNSEFEMNIRNWTVNEGDTIFLYGPSGSGKTTLLGLLTGILKPQTGSLRILKQDFARLSSFERDRFRAIHMGYVFQQLNLISYLSVLENILISIWNAPKRYRSNRFKSPEEEARFLAKRLDIESSLSRYPHQLSVGQQQRVAVARALIGPPQLLIADEPTSALDDDRQRSFLQLLLDLASEYQVSVVFVSHNRQLAELFDSQISIQEILQGGKSNAI